MKFCRKCGVELVRGVNWGLTRHKLLCRVHLNEDQREKYRKNWKRYRAYTEKYEAKNNKTSKRKKQLLETAHRMYKKYPSKWLARAKLKYMVQTGRIKRGACIKCGSLKTDGHHEDYSKPYEVIWFCHKHHLEHHRLIKQAI